MESKDIALALEKEYPHPSAHPDSPVLNQVEEARAAALGPLFPMLVPRMPRDCLSGPTIEYHIEARKRTFGMTLEEYEAEHGGEPAWESAISGLQQLAAILKEDRSRPFCLGDTPSYADFLIVGFLEWCRCLQGGIFERIVGIDSAFQDVYDACKPCLERNDY
jgi:glutathione S-transferase